MMSPLFENDATLSRDMNKSSAISGNRPMELLRIRTITNLRWFAVIGQLTVTLLVRFGMGYPLPLGPILSVIAIGAAVNYFVWQQKRPNKAVAGNELAGHLLFDVLQIGGILFLTGGIGNPFAVWLILPSMLAAFALDIRRAGVVIVGIVLVLTLIALWHSPLPGPEQASPLIELGSWAALLLGVVFTAAYARQVAISQRRLSTALDAAHGVLAREERLTAVGGLAAAAAHELGTPLATIQVTAREMERELPDGPLKEDAQLLISQTQRCQRILTRLSEVGESGDARHAQIALEELLREAAKPFLTPKGPKVSFVFDPRSDSAPPDQLVRNPAMIYGLRTLIENGVKFARETVRVTASWDSNSLFVTIEDDGHGFPHDVLSRLGEPFPRTDSYRALNGKQGLGLGFFIAKTLLERSGASLTFGNRLRLSGAWVEVRWPLVRLHENPIYMESTHGEPMSL
ncbi:ActS/PrrB/RegB family redox-sensitive histidine kinase [Parvularcula bermudensis]|nr:ActS/PrrB/RegB family redox-sensitive histidine kinase [Parvularcula bermudensis]